LNQPQRRFRRFFFCRRGIDGGSKVQAEHIAQGSKLFGDGIAVGVLVAGIAQLLPQIATLLTIVWMVLRIYESDTVQKIIERRKARRESDIE